jgi:hypothetical protein
VAKDVPYEVTKDFEDLKAQAMALAAPNPHAPPHHPPPPPVLNPQPSESAPPSSAVGGSDRSDAGRGMLYLGLGLGMGLGIGLGVGFAIVSVVLARFGPPRGPQR